MSRSALSPDGLARLHDAMAHQVATGQVPGLVTLVALHRDMGVHETGVHDVHVDVVGNMALGDDPAPMARDSIFRIASLTKPIAAAAAMVLVEDGALSLGSSVEDLLPELADRRVLRRIDGPLDDTVAARRAITVDDVLTFRLGFGSLLVRPGTYPIQVAEHELQLRTLEPPWPPTPHTPDEWMRHFGSLPLMYQPGERWLYNTAAHVLGVLVERAAGKPLEVFMRERIFEPLGMVDTGFSVAPHQRQRFTTAYSPDRAGGLELLDAVADSYWARPPASPSAASWLVSTIDDYWAFVQMMISRGEHGGHRVLSPRSVELMTTNHLTVEQRASARHFLGQAGWGFAMASPGETGIPAGFGWDGGTGTTWRTDPSNGLTGIMFTQRSMLAGLPDVYGEFWRGAYGAIEG